MLWRKLMVGALGLMGMTSWGTVANAAGSAVEPDRAFLEFHLPDGAALEIQGVRTDARGPVRHIRSTPLEPGRRYIYDVRVTWREGGETKSAVREVRIQAGKRFVVDFHADGLAPDERAVLELTNLERARAGLSPLTADLRLCQAARQHTANMARQNVIAHTLAGTTFVDRMQRAGYMHTAAGENCAQGQATPAAAVASWMLSPGHRSNLLNPRYTEIGIGVESSAGGERFYTQLFARPAGGAAPVPW